jgi:alkyl hydroperoxide reductase subunit AhpC
LLQIVKSRGFGTFWIARQELDICGQTISLISAAETAGRAERTPADNQTVRSVFVIGPDKKIKLVLVYPITTE